MRLLCIRKVTLDGHFKEGDIFKLEHLSEVDEFQSGHIVFADKKGNVKSGGFNIIPTSRTINGKTCNYRDIKTYGCVFRLVASHE